MKTCVHRYLLPSNIPLFLLCMLFTVACEIDDPYASYSFKPKSPTQISNSGFYWTDWLDNETLLLWFSGNVIWKYNIASNNESTFYALEELPTTDYYSNPILLAEDNILLMTLSKQTTDNWGNLVQNTYLHITNFETNETRTLSKTVTYGGIVSEFPYIAFVSNNQNGIQETQLYNYETDNYINIGPGYPVAFSPEGEELLYFNSNEYKHYIYNLPAENNTPFAYFINNYGGSEVYWNEEGIFEFLFSYEESGQIISLRNVIANSILLSRNTISLGLHTSPSANGFLFGEVHCQSPYLEYCSVGTYVSLKFASTLKPDRELMTEVAYYDNSIVINDAKFSPDEKHIAIIRSNLVYLINNPN